jgi:uncharacterized protein YdhG (YjbR/CyaY superfamily)
MKSNTASIEDYLRQVPQDQQAHFQQLRAVMLANLPAGFVEQMNYGIIGYVVPHSLYPAGYHCKPSTPLPFAGIASQKNFIAIHHMGIYSNPELMDWFVKQYPAHCKLKLDMGKSCIRFKKTDQIPYDLIAELMQKMTVDDWIQLYEANIRR